MKIKNIFTFLICYLIILIFSTFIVVKAMSLNEKFDSVFDLPEIIYKIIIK